MKWRKMSNSVGCQQDGLLPYTDLVAAQVQGDRACLQRQSVFTLRF